jgi:hypothetical protein
MTNAYGNTRSSNPPCIWSMQGGIESDHEAVPGLPQTFYDHSWYAGLSNRDKKDLNAKMSAELCDIVEDL